MISLIASEEIQTRFLKIKKKGKRKKSVKFRQLVRAHSRAGNILPKHDLRKKKKTGFLRKHACVRTCRLTSVIGKCYSSS